MNTRSHEGIAEPLLCMWSEFCVTPYQLTRLAVVSRKRMWTNEADVVVALITGGLFVCQQVYHTCNDGINPLALVSQEEAPVQQMEGEVCLTRTIRFRSH